MMRSFLNKYKSSLIPIFLLLVFGKAQVFGQSGNDQYYVGESECRKCHHINGNRNQYNSWRLSKHADAYAALFMPESREIAELSGIDVEPYESPICLGCHTTAYDVEAWERDDTFKLEDGVQCELCHGPGSEYRALEKMKNRDLAVKAGLKFPDERFCMICHKEKGSHTAVLDVKKFIYEEAIAEIAHPGKGGPLKIQKSTFDSTDKSSGFTGVFACASCHGVKSVKHEFSKWRLSKHAEAYALLSSEKALKIAKEMKIKTHPQKSGTCLNCHSTIAEEDIPVSNMPTDIAQGVQCERCHGPGREHAEAAMNQKPYPQMNSVMKNVDKSICRTCHTPKIHGSEFDVDHYWSQIDHSIWEKKKSQVIYKTPFNLAITKDGRRLFIACEASNSLLILDIAKEKIMAEVETGSQPHFVCFSPDEKLAYVSNRGSDNVSVVDTKSHQVIAEIDVGDEPHEMVVDKKGTKLYVVNAGTYDVSVVDLRIGREIKRLAASRGPWGAALSPSGKNIYVTNNLPRYGEFRGTSMSEVTVIETNRSTVSHRYTVPDANLIQGIAAAPGGDFFLVTLIRTKNLVPMTRNIQGWIMTNGIGILWQDGSVDQLLLDGINDFFADPTDVVFSKDGQYAFVSGGGVQEIAVIDIDKMLRILKNAKDEERRDVLPNHLGKSLEYVTKRILVGQSPRGMVVSEDNKYLYVADGLDDAISVIDINKQERIKVIALTKQDTITEARYGERIFHSATFTYGRQFSCHSCHPDGGVDGITYDIEPDGLGINPVDNRTLRGINDTAPFKWTGKNPSLRRQCGARLAAFFTRIDPFTQKQSNALERYIVTIPRPPNRFRTSDELTAAQRRGKRIFQRRYDNAGNEIPQLKQCNHCHRYPYFTNREKFDVGSASPIDTHGTFDVPHLNNIYATSPYLHDGRAHSLDAIWMIYNPNDTHGQTNDLTKDQMNDLIEYLKTL